MGGSSLGPEVIRRSYGEIPDGLRLHVLDSTDPGAVLAIERAVDLEHDAVHRLLEVGRDDRDALAHAPLPTSAASDDGSRFVAITDPGSPLVDVAERARLPARVRERPRHRRPLLGAVLLRARAGRADGREHRGDAAPRPGGRAELRAVRRGLGQLGPLAGRRARRARAARARQGDLRGLRRDRVLRPLGRAADRRVDRQAGQGRPAGRRRAARRARVLRRRPRLRLPARPRRAGRRPGRRGRGARPRRPPDGHARRARRRRPRAHLLLRASSRSRSRAGCSASTRSTSPTSRRRRTTPPRCSRRASCPRSTRATRSELFARSGPPRYVAIMGYVDAVGASSTRRSTSCACAIRDHTKSATTFGYGPRYLHSTGQFHKGGPLDRAVPRS